MWSHSRSKKPNNPEAKSHHESGGHQHFRLRDIFSLSKSHKHDEGTAQAAKSESKTKPAPRAAEYPEEVATTEIEKRDQSLKASQITCIDEPERDHPVAAANAIPETEDLIPPAAEPPIPGTDADEGVDQGAIKQAHRDLWHEAAGKLDEKQKTILGLLDMPESPPRSAVNAIQDVVQKTEKSLAAYNSSGRIKLRDGKVLIDVHENAKKVLRGTLRVMDIIDAGVKFDPTGYGSFSLYLSIYLSFFLFYNHRFCLCIPDRLPLMLC